MAASQIIPDNAKIIEGDMGEVRAAGAIADRPNVGHCGLQPLIDFNVTTFGQFDSCQFQANAFVIGSAAAGDEKMCAFQDYFARPVGNVKLSPSYRIFLRRF